MLETGNTNIISFSSPYEGFKILDNLKQYFDNQLDTDWADNLRYQPQQYELPEEDDDLLFMQVEEKTPFDVDKKIVLRAEDIVSNAKPSNGSSSILGKYKDSKLFTNQLVQAYRSALGKKGLDPEYAKILAAQDSLESGYGKHVSGNFNYGGIKVGKKDQGKGLGKVRSTKEYINGKLTSINDEFRNFKSLEDYCNYKIDMFQNKRYDAFNRVKANNPLAFISNINNSGYSTTPTSKYASSIMSIYNKI